MAKMFNILLVALLVLAILIVGIAAFEYNAFPGTNTNTTASPKPTGNTTVDAASKPISAFQALAIADSNRSVIQQKAGKTSAYVTDISSENCVKGLSESWQVTYYLDGQQALVRVSNGNVTSVNVSPGAAISPKIDPSGLVDSDTMDGFAAGALELANKYPAGPTSIEVMAGGESPVWDFIYQVQDGNYLVRLNAINGTVVASTPLNS